MAVELVTGFAGYGSDGAPNRHVSSSEDGARQAGTVGTGMYVMETVDDPLAATLENSNTVTVGPGDVLMNGRHVQLTGSTSFAIPVGTQAMQTSNMLVLRYTLGDTGVESVEALTLTGTPAESDPQDPAINSGSILDGDSPVDMPLYRVVTTGIETAEPVKLFETVPPYTDLDIPTQLSELGGTLDASKIAGTLPVSHGGTGATSGTSALNNLGIKKWLLDNVFKIGYVWVSYTSTSPASIVGGTWAPITGRFPYFNAGTDTGGSNSHTHGLSKGAAAVHMETGGGSNHDMVFSFRPASGITFSPSYKHFLSATHGGAASEPLNTPAQLVGNTESSKNMPAYQTLYAWRRTA